MRAVCYLVARRHHGLGCVAIKAVHGPHLVALKRQLSHRIGLLPIELITISRPMAYLEYAPYRIATTETEFIEAVEMLCKSAQEGEK